MAVQMADLVCHQCRKPVALPLGARIGRRDECPHCHASLHCCLNCQYYDTLVHHECREPQADWVRDKSAPNFCDYFGPREGALAQAGADKAAALSRLEALFKK
jgi:LSD1 subclass zinc finger protein